ncbi:MAG: polysaccharide biosynthesis/export family protein [Candidatus Eremiobacteraeota bacterium]|nr:polysaccharide biosynthesis/export family protein [Candidatus Eremiobacteraeota bacterium]
MILRSTHSLRALAAAAAILLGAAPLAALAQSVTPLEPPPPVQQPIGPSSTVSPTIHPGDQLAISVYGHPDLTQNAVVQADGTIQYPLVGRVLVTGMSSAEARDALAHSLQKYLKHPIVSLAVQQQGSINVLVLGNVKTSGRYTLRSGSHLSDAIAAAAGIVQMNGDFPPARLSQDGTTQTIDLQKLLHDGDTSQNPELSDNAIVYVTGAETIRVQVLGAVSRPGNVEVNVGDRLSMALARAGAEASAKSDLNRVYLTRTDPTTGKTLPSYQINVFEALQRGDQRYDPILRKDDKIYVPEARTISPAMMGILGALGSLLRL